MKAYIGCSTDEYIRTHAASGGIGTAVIKWLFSQGLIDSAITFQFNHDTLQYLPKIIYKYEDYHVTGAIYQEISLVSFIRDNIDQIKGTFACFALPCQTKYIRHTVEQAGHKAFIIGLTCSAQQTLGATKYLLKRVGVKPGDVDTLEYQGSGRAGHVIIGKKDGTVINVSNDGSSSIWYQIFHSMLFVRRKCFTCQDTLNRHSDLTLADPLLRRPAPGVRIGKTLVACDSELGEKAITKCHADGDLTLENIDYDEMLLTQKDTIMRKDSYLRSPELTNHYLGILSNGFYKKIVLGQKALFELHCRLNNGVESYLLTRLREDD